MNQKKEMINEIGEVHSLLNKAGLADIVDVRVETMENQYDRMTPHIIARYTETRTGYNAEKDGYVYTEKTSERYEELNKWFSGRIFALGITQRADWLKATAEERVSYLKGSDSINHPAGFKKSKQSS
jgi:hypothetical protein